MMREIQEYRHKVQYYETDQMGIVHHSNYIRWFEEARTALLEQMGMGYDRMEALKEYNGLKLTLEYEVTDEKTGMVHCRGLTKHCFLNEKGRPVSLKKDYPDNHALFVEMMEQGKQKPE